MFGTSTCASLGARRAPLSPSPRLAGNSVVVTVKPCPITGESAIGGREANGASGIASRSCEYVSQTCLPRPCSRVLWWYAQDPDDEDGSCRPRENCHPFEEHPANGLIADGTFMPPHAFLVTVELDVFVAVARQFHLQLPAQRRQRQTAEGPPQLSHPSSIRLRSSRFISRNDKNIRIVSKTCSVPPHHQTRTHSNPSPLASENHPMLVSVTLERVMR